MNTLQFTRFIFVGIASTLLFISCATPDVRKIEEFATAEKLEVAHASDAFMNVEVSRVSALSLREMFKTPKVNKGFAVYWLSVTATGDKALEFNRNKVSLISDGWHYYPVGPGRVSYLCKSDSTAMLILAVVAPAVVPIGGVVATSGNTAYQVGVNVTGVAATAHVAGAQGQNKTREQTTRLGSFPETAVIQPGECLAGFIFFEVDQEQRNSLEILGEAHVDGEPIPFHFTQIPEVTVTFNKEKNNAKKR